MGNREVEADMVEVRAEDMVSKEDTTITTIKAVAIGIKMVETADMVETAVMVETADMVGTTDTVGTVDMVVAIMVMDINVKLMSFRQVNEMQNLDGHLHKIDHIHLELMS